MTKNDRLLGRVMYIFASIQKEILCSNAFHFAMDFSFRQDIRESGNRRSITGTVKSKG
jgi:hypothetical protein